MRVEHRIPTAQFGYVSLNVEAGDVLEAETVQTLMDDHARLQRAYSGSEGIPEKEMNTVIDNMLLDNGENHIETWERMSPKQKEIAQCLKRALKRLEAKQGKELRDRNNE